MGLVVSSRGLEASTRGRSFARRLPDRRSDLARVRSETKRPAASRLPRMSFGTPFLHTVTSFRDAGDRLDRDRSRAVRPKKENALTRSEYSWAREWPLSSRSSSHDDSTCGIEPASRFVFDDCQQRRTQVRGRDDFEAETRIKRHVPREVPEGGQRDRCVPVAAGPFTDLQDQLCSQPTASVCRSNVDLLEVYGVALDHLNVRKADCHIAQQRHPEVPLPLSPLQNVRGRRLVQDGLRCMPREEPRSCQFQSLATARDPVAAPS